MGILSSIENRIIVEGFTDDQTEAGVRFLVVDYKYPFARKNNIRRIEFQNGESFLYSSVYLSAQRIVDCFFGRAGMGSALVLGCAGCTVPRFLINRYKGCFVTGVEYSTALIGIAKKHFITERMKERFELVNDDAFMFVNEAQSGSFDLVFVDIFIAERIHSSIFSPSFIDELYRVTGEQAIVVFNLFGVGSAKAKRFAEGISAPFDKKYVIEDYRKLFLALVKCKDSSHIEHFEKRIKKYADIL